MPDRHRHRHAVAEPGPPRPAPRTLLRRRLRTSRGSRHRGSPLPGSPRDPDLCRVVAQGFATLRHAARRARPDQVGKQLSGRLDHEATLQGTRMGQHTGRIGLQQIAEEQQVEIERPGCVANRSRAAAPTSESAFEVLKDSQHGLGGGRDGDGKGKHRVEEIRRIRRAIQGPRAPDRRGSNLGCSACVSTKTGQQLGAGIPKLRGRVAEVGAQGHQNPVRRLRHGRSAGSSGTPKSFSAFSSARQVT